MNQIAPLPAVIEPALADDLLEGAAEIAAFLGWSEREIYYLAERKKSGKPVSWPIFQIDGQYTARKSTLHAFIAERERAAVGENG